MQFFAFLRRTPFVRVLALAFACAGAFVTPVHAGSEAAKVGVDKYGDSAIRDFALRVNDQLDARKAHVAILARCGRPRSEMPHGISYTHVAFAVFEAVRGDDGAIFHTYTVYNLYQDSAQEDRSYLKQDLIYNFVAGIDETDVAVCVPIEPLQKRLLAMIRSPAYRALYIPEYNLMANPWVDRYDNCVTHTLKVCVAAIYDTTDRARINANIRTYFTPTPVRLGALRSFGALFKTAVKHDDAAPSGFQTATYDSLKVFLETNQLVREAFTVTLK
ncbi:MAG: DUF2145 domain-containing protein [Verrucomicrobiota bacterium]